MLSKFAGDGVDVVNSDFVKSSVTTEDCPSDGSPEFALVGRSNVGKSSLLNSLVRRKRLALTSKKPGRKNSSVCVCFLEFLRDVMESGLKNLSNAYDLSSLCCGLRDVWRSI